MLNNHLTILGVDSIIENNNMIIFSVDKDTILYIIAEGSNDKLMKIYILDDVKLTINSLLINTNIKINIYLEKTSVLNINNIIISTLDSNITIDVFHLKDKGSSTLNNYALVNDSILVINANASIVKNSKFNIVNQNTKGVLLNSFSKINTKPMLSIKTNDCEASHSAAIGALNTEEVYYLMSRGLSEENAKTLIIKSFLNPIIDNIDNKIIIDKLNIYMKELFV